MKYVQINAYAKGWADSVVFKKHRELSAQGDESYVIWARGKHNQNNYMIKIASTPEVCLDAFLTRFDGKAGFHSKRITERLLRHLEDIDPDVIHLHVLLGYYINVEMLFIWLSKHRCQVVWTLHDCWAFTGHCIYFTYANCTQWMKSCSSSCPQTNTYPKTYCCKNVKLNFERKKHLFTLLPEDQMRLITPSRWLANLVKQSFLSKYGIEVVHNSIDTNVFKPVPNDFKKKNGLEEKFIILGVASVWSERKGLDDFVRLSSMLDDRYAIVLVGLSRLQRRMLPKQIIALSHIDSAEKLAELYTAADVFFNPTKEENYPTVNLEAQACGTPVVTYDVGGCAETLGHREGNAAIPPGSLKEFLRLLA